MKLRCCDLTAFYDSPTRRPLLSLRPRKCSVSFSIYSSHSHGVSLAELLQYETLRILEWPAVCSQLAAFTSTPMGLSAARSSRIPLGSSPEESLRLLAQTSAAFALPQRLDFSGIHDVTDIVDTAVSGQILSIHEICSVKRTLLAARSLLKQLEEMSSQNEFRDRYKKAIRNAFASRYGYIMD